MFFATLKLYFSYISAMDCLSNFYCFSGKIISHIASAEKVDPRISKIDMNSIFISRGGRSDHDDGAKKKEIRGPRGDDHRVGLCIRVHKPCFEYFRRSRKTPITS
jgi:hypothetical protein